MTRWPACVVCGKPVDRAPDLGCIIHSGCVPDGSELATVLAAVAVLALAIVSVVASVYR